MSLISFTICQLHFSSWGYPVWNAVNGKHLTVTNDFCRELDLGRPEPICPFCKHPSKSDFCHWNSKQKLAMFNPCLCVVSYKRSAGSLYFGCIAFASFCQDEFLAICCKIETITEWKLNLFAWLCKWIKAPCALLLLGLVLFSSCLWSREDRSFFYMFNVN